MWQERVCFDCAYWNNWLHYPEPNTIIVSGNLYHLDKPLEKPSKIRLSQLKHCKYMLVVNTHDVYVCTGLTLRGRIPNAWKNILPNQYVFITRDEYYLISNYEATHCSSKGCFDRYHCFWYNAQLTEPFGPWNVIPSDYRVGSEMCPSFINKHKLYDNN